MRIQPPRTIVGSVRLPPALIRFAVGLGTLLAAIILGRDLNARRRASQVFLATEERYRDLIENANDIVYTLDLAGNITSINAAVESVTGYRPEELLRQPVSRLIRPDFMARMSEMLTRKIAGDERTKYELEVIARDGRIVTLEVNSRLLRENNRPSGISGIARDITDRKRAEERTKRLLRRWP
jgi:PAS domain S-box-containing protein